MASNNVWNRRFREHRAILGGVLLKLGNILKKPRGKLFASVWFARKLSPFRIVRFAGDAGNLRFLFAFHFRPTYRLSHDWFIDYELEILTPNLHSALRIVEVGGFTAAFMAYLGEDQFLAGLLGCWLKRVLLIYRLSIYVEKQNKHYIKTYYNDVYRSVTNEQHNTTTTKPQRKHRWFLASMCHLSTEEWKILAGKINLGKPPSLKRKPAQKQAVFRLYQRDRY